MNTYIQIFYKKNYLNFEDLSLFCFLRFMGHTVYYRVSTKKHHPSSAHAMTTRQLPLNAFPTFAKRYMDVCLTSRQICREALGIYQ